MPSIAQGSHSQSKEQEGKRDNGVGGTWELRGEGTKGCCQGDCGQKACGGAHNPQTCCVCSSHGGPSGLSAGVPAQDPL